VRIVVCWLEGNSGGEKSNVLQLKILLAFNSCFTNLHKSLLLYSVKLDSAPPYVHLTLAMSGNGYH
jgi:hypothetical protein